MQTLNFFQKVSLTLVAVNLAIASGNAVAASFSGSTFDPGKIDSGIPGFVGPDGLGVISANNTINPIFKEWATGFINYQPASGVSERWQTPEKALGEVTGAFDGIVSLGELTNEPDRGTSKLKSLCSMEYRHRLQKKISHIYHI